MSATTGFARTSIQYRLRRGLACALVVLALAACGGGGGGGSDSGDGSGSGGDGSTSLSPSEAAEAIKRVDTSGAQGYVVTGGDDDTASGAAVAEGVTHSDVVTAAETAVDLEPDSIYKVTDDGRLVRAPVEDGSGDEVPRGTVRPFAVRNANDAFIIMVFEIPGLDAGDWCVAADGCNDNLVPYLVRKADGAAFDASPVYGNLSNALTTPTPNEEGSYRLGALPEVQTDSSGNMFTWVPSVPWTGDSDYEPNVSRIDISDIDNGNVTASTLQDTDSIESFAVDGAGDYMLYEGGRLSDDVEVLRMVDVSSGVRSEVQPAIGSAVETAQVIGDHQGNTYVIAHNTATNGGDDVYRISQNDAEEPVATDLGNLTAVSVCGCEFASDSWPLFIDDGSDYERLIVNGREIVVDTNNGEAVELALDRTNSSGEPLPTLYYHDGVTEILSDIREARISGRYIWFFGTEGATGLDAIVRYEPLSEATKTFNDFTDPDTGSTLEINSFEVLSIDRVFFEGLRVVDGAQVIGEIAGDGTVTITDTVAADEPEVFTLAPISPADFVVIDGAVRDWALDMRVTDDDSGDAGDGDDLAFYSQQTGNEDYLGLVEFDGAIGLDNRTRVRINGTHGLRIDDDASTIVPIDGADAYVTGEPQTLTDVGGESAIGEAVEFRVPQAALGDPEAFDATIARVGDGDVEDLTESKEGGKFTITVAMATPLGVGENAGEVKLSLDGGSYTLRIDTDSVDFTDHTGRSDQTMSLNDIGGNIIRSDREVVIELPESAVGSPETVQPEEISTEALPDELATP